MTDIPKGLTENPISHYVWNRRPIVRLITRALPGCMAMGADALSDVLRTVRLTGAVFFYFDLKGAWVAEAPPVRECIPFVMPEVQHLIEFHLVTSGHCWGGLLDAEPVHLETGDIIVFPQGDPQ